MCVRGRMDKDTLPLQRGRPEVWRLHLALRRLQRDCPIRGPAVCRSFIFKGQRCAFRVLILPLICKSAIFEISLLQTVRVSVVRVSANHRVVLLSPHKTQRPHRLICIVTLKPAVRCRYGTRRTERSRFRWICVSDNLWTALQAVETFQGLPEIANSLRHLTSAIAQVWSTVQRKRMKGMKDYQKGRPLRSVAIAARWGGPWRLSLQLLEHAKEHVLSIRTRRVPITEIFFIFFFYILIGFDQFCTDFDCETVDSNLKPSGLLVSTAGLAPVWREENSFIGKKPAGRRLLGSLAATCGLWDQN